MEFWGVEVPAGKPLKVTPEEGILVHISHASLGDCKNKKGETVPLYVKVGDEKFVLGTLVSGSIPQTNFDLVFDKEFELSHEWGKSVHFAAEVKKNAKPEADDVEEDESDSDEGMSVDEDDTDDEDDSEEEKEETPKKPESSKKRANEAAPKTPVSAKKAKAEVTPKKTDEKKKGGHTATPHPAKKGGKTPATATPVSCASCKKTFNSENALESHTKAKHSSAK
ncbi:unnamed protein product [Thlaspi arvense]|uniref:C2H2-type domain-containing protein n=1 Tax=Thlaspi arvense TaxID=13288 RepID=A0AAU9SD55_THLAR|nr:unnamed protein product [Thlaspi arvense]